MTISAQEVFPNQLARKYGRFASGRLHSIVSTLIQQVPGAGPEGATARTPDEKVADQARAAHITRLSAGPLLAASTVTPQIITLYTEREPQGVHIPSSTSTGASKGSDAIARGGTLEAFVNEMDAFASVVGATLETTHDTPAQGCTLRYRTSDSSTVSIPEPSYSLGEVAVAQALYRSAAAGGAVERVSTTASSEPAL